MDVFHYEDKKLYIEDLCYEDILQCYETPILVYSKRRLVENMNSLKKAFALRNMRTKICFAYKACYLPGILKVIEQNGLGAEVSSAYEYKIAKKIGVKDTDIYWNSPGKSQEELELLVKRKVHVNVDSLEEVLAINDLAQKEDRIIEIGMRLNLNHKEMPTAIQRGGKLGIDIESGQAYEVCKVIKGLKHVRLIGLHCHLSVENKTPSNYVLVLKALINFAIVLRKDLDMKMQYFCPGGGFEARNRMEEAGSQIEEFADAIAPLFKQLDYEPELILEPGRYIVDDAAICIGKILCKKQCFDSMWWITDMGTNLLLPFGGREYPIRPVEMQDSDKVCVNIGDRTSNFSGVLRRNEIISDQEKGNYLAAFNCGSYTFTCSQNFMYPLSYDIFLVDENKYERIQKKKSEEQYIGELFEEN